MTAPTVRDQEVAAYLRAVRAELDDLPADERDELLEGLEADLAELRAEARGGLAERLGSPAAYAAELRSAAGLPPHVPRRDPDRLDRIRAARDRLEARPGAQACRRFLAGVRPGWWGLRGYLAAWVVSALLLGGDVGGPVPSPGGSVVSGVLLTVAFMAASMWLGRRTDRGTGMRVAMALVNAVLLFTALVVSVEVDRFDGSSEYSAPCCGLISGGGAVTDIRPYDSTGKPLTDVQLYDQYGTPLDVEVDGPPRVRRDGTLGHNVFPIHPAPNAGMGESAPPTVAPVLPRPTPAP